MHDDNARVKTGRGAELRSAGREFKMQEPGGLLFFLHLVSVRRAVVFLDELGLLDSERPPQPEFHDPPSPDLCVPDS
jgi:hypothetical protein